MSVPPLLPLLLPLLFLPGCGMNEIRDSQVNDVEIMANVKSKLVRDIGLTTTPDISVNSTNGVVTLSGAVDTPTARIRAEEIARGVPHVVRVVNNIQVAPAPAAGHPAVPPLWRADASPSITRSGRRLRAPVQLAHAP